MEELKNEQDKNPNQKESPIENKETKLLTTLEKKSEIQNKETHNPPNSHNTNKEKSLTIKELREICQPKKNVWLWRDKFVRFVSIYLTRLFIPTGISANGVTWIMLFLGIISAILYAIGGYKFAILGLVAHHLYFILDAVDGEVARYRKKPSNKGMYIDLMSHIIVHPLIIMGIAFGVFFHNPLSIPDYTYLLLGFLGAFSYMLGNFASDKKYEIIVKKGDLETLGKTSKVLKQGEGDGKVNHLKEEIWFLISFEVFNLMFIFTILNALHYLVFIYAGLFSLNAIKKFYIEYKKIKD